jgi:tRNA U34 5-carboxymethylaminomethyl modifying GTPase MnmE/TrmE
MRKPEGLNVWQWAMKDVSVKTIVVVIGLMVSSHYATQTRVTLVEQKQPENDRRFDEVTRQLNQQRDEIKGKVDFQTYEIDQQKIAASLAAIEASVNNIETILMEQHPVRIHN